MIHPESEGQINVITGRERGGRDFRGPRGYDRERGGRGGYRDRYDNRRGVERYGVFD